MASRNFEKRQTKKRKALQAEERYIAAMRREAVLYEGYTERNVARMSKEQLEEVVRRGKRGRVLLARRLDSRSRLPPPRCYRPRQRS